MKKLTVLVVIMLVAVLFIGCFPSTYRITPNLASNTVFLGKETEIYEFQLVVTYSNGDIDVTSECDYYSTNTDAATVGNQSFNKGLIEAIAPGSATIHITYWNGTHEYSFDVIVEVSQ